MIENTNKIAKEADLEKIEEEKKRDEETLNKYGDLKPL